MKRYVIIILLISQMKNIVAGQEFRNKFLNWKKSLTQPQKESINTLIDDYDYAYKNNDTLVLGDLEIALQQIMNKWNSLYRPLVDAKSFYNSVQEFVLSHPKDKAVKEYLLNYNQYDQLPAKRSYKRLMNAQKNLEISMKKS